MANNAAAQANTAATVGDTAPAPDDASASASVNHTSLPTGNAAYARDSDPSPSGEAQENATIDDTASDNSFLDEAELMRRYIEEARALSWTQRAEIRRRLELQLSAIGIADIEDEEGGNNS
jgi:hypothetical protein